MTDFPSATLEGMQRWALDLMLSRQPDQVIGDDYLRRWYVIPRNPFANVYLHFVRHSDDDRALHDHPWDNRTVVLSGGYVEVTPQGSVERKVGDVVERKAEAMHRLVVPDGGHAITLFFTGPRLREWGFDCPGGWVHWRDFTDPDDPTKVGPGCGENLEITHLGVPADA